jgi:hypothetical protein
LFMTDAAPHAFPWGYCGHVIDHFPCPPTFLSAWLILYRSQPNFP